jgi:hypothetical protein
VSTVDRLAPRQDLTPGERARLFLGDARRMVAAQDLETATQRFALAHAAAPDSTAGIAAQAEMALADLMHSADVSRMPELVAQMETAQRGGPEAWGEIQPYLRPLRVAAAVVSQPLVDPGGALLFGAAEFVRDSMVSAQLAAAMFWRVYEDHPESFIAPKALLAAADVDWERADSAMVLLDALYADSPYRLVLTGGGAAEFQLAEDSLRILIAAGLMTVETRGGVILEADEEELRRDRRQ